MNSMSTTLTFRLAKEREERLRREAEEKGISLNTLANQIFEEHEWNRYMQKFGTIILSRDAFKMLLDELDEDTIIRIADEIGDKIPKEFILFKWKEINMNNILSFLKIYFKHCRYGEYDESFNKISIKHDLGMKGSLFLKTFIDTTLRTFNKRCIIKYTEHTLIVDLSPSYG